MGCVGSKQGDEKEVCRERKRVLKLAVHRRYAFAHAQSEYNHSLCAVAAAIRLFVARHSSPPDPFLICAANPPSAHSQPTTVPSDSSSSSSSSSSEQEVICEHFYDAAPPPPAPPLHRNLIWDFFDTFEDPNGFNQTWGREKVAQNDNVRAHTEREAKAEAEKKRREEEGNVISVNVPTNGRELLEALKDVEDHCLRAYDSGLHISRMLESHRVKMQSGLQDIKESSNKLLRSVTRSRSTLSRSSSCRSLLSTSTSRNSSAWTDFKNDLFDDYVGMESGCHSLTLERLYAWEKKLYAEVKAGEEARKIYERKCVQSRNRNSFCYVDRRKVDEKALYTKILVAVQCADSMSKRIQKLRDEELQPQFLELLHGLMKTWKIMLASHETQNRIMVEVKSFNCPAHGNFYNDSHRLATLQLEAELRHWSSCFAAYVYAQRAYVEALDGWLSKFITPEVEVYTRDWRPIPSKIENGPPLLVVCYHWLNSLKKLPDESVTFSMKRFGKDLRALWIQQGEEQRQKRKVDELEKELNKRVRAFERAERRILESKISDRESELDVSHRAEYLTGKKDQLDMFRKKLEAEKRKQHASVQETQHVTVNGFHTGFSSVFASLAGFSSASVRMYSDLITCFENANAAKSQG